MRPFDEKLVRRLAALKAWTDRRHDPRYDPERLLAAIVPANFRWTDLKGLVPREQTDKPAEQQRICDRGPSQDRAFARARAPA